MCCNDNIRFRDNLEVFGNCGGHEDRIIVGPRGPIGPQGIAGERGERGERGEHGDPGHTPAAYAANNGAAAIAVIPAGTLVPLPAAILTAPEITINAADTLFTVHEHGRYRISYTLNATTPIPASSAVLVNDTTVISTIFTGGQYRTGEVYIFLNAGDTIGLRLFGVTETVTLQVGAGATLMLIKLD